LSRCYWNPDNEEFNKCKDCTTKYEPLIITPTLLKTYDNTLLRLIWREAEDKISKADEVVFVGYSMPDADMQLRCMFKRALYANRNRSHREGSGSCCIRVIGNERRSNDQEGNRGNDTEKRYRQLFGEIDYEPIGFKAYIERV
jgi:hypothetical protein